MKVEDDFSDESLPDSDVELQEAFARGDLKPGLVILEKHSESAEKKPVIYNNVPRLKSILQQIKLPTTFNWVERLDIISDKAPLAPEIAVQLEEHREKREKEIKHANLMKKKKKKSTPSPLTLKSIEEDPIHNDFQRELNFHRQAQAAIMTCIPKLQAMGIPTRRPEDYFAEMAKSDDHMQKVASVLLKKQTAAEKAEKVRKMRDQKKIAKQTQVQVLQERQKAKKELIDNVKKYRKGQKNSLDFLEEKKSSRGGGRGGRGGGSGGVNRKRELKNERYGYGGKKSGFKRNTRDSLDNVPSRGFRGAGGGRGGRGGSRGGFRGGRGGHGGGGDRAGNNMPPRSGRGKAPRVVAKRPGKSNRVKARARS